MGNLQPVTIVDKNGRTTTVHRRDATKSSVGTGLPSPKLSPQNGTQGTPLEPIPLTTASQTKVIIAEFEKGEVYWNLDAKSLSTNLSRKDKGLIYRMLKNPDIDSELVKMLVSYALWNEGTKSEEISSALLIAEKIISNGDTVISSEWGVSTFLETVIGIDQRGAGGYLRPVKEIETQEELAGKAAVTTFTLTAWNEFPDDGSVTAKGSKKFNFRWKRDFRFVANRHLESLLMERPEKRYTITEYVRKRGMHPANKKPVDALRSYLDEGAEATAVSSGWL
jgi:hypothetical protein